MVWMTNAVGGAYHSLPNMNNKELLLLIILLNRCRARVLSCCGWWQCPVQTRREDETFVADIDRNDRKPNWQKVAIHISGQCPILGVDTMTQVNIGKDIELNVDVARLPQNVLDHVVYIGLRNILMDSHASITAEKSTDVYGDSRAMAEKKLEAMYNGEVRSAGTRTADPVKAEAIRIASDRIKAAWRKAGKKLAALDSKDLRNAAVALVEKTPAITEQARANVAAARELDVEVDLAGLTG